MARCRHPSTTLIFEGSQTSQTRIQIYQCRHCRAVQSHVVEAGRVEVHDWKQLPFPSLPVRHQLHCLLALAKPVRLPIHILNSDRSFDRALA